MTNEQDFFRELGIVPDLPAGLYDSLRRNIRQRLFFSRAALAAAALFIVSAGTTGILLTHDKNSRVVLPEVVAELQTVQTYLNSGDIDKEYESYVLYEEDQQ
jgi:hypothetical protein